MDEVIAGIAINAALNMFLPAEYTWFEPVLIAAIIVFIIDLIGSMMVFGRRPVLNAFASAILFAVIFGVAGATSSSLANTRSQGNERLVDTVSSKSNDRLGETQC